MTYNSAYTGPQIDSAARLASIIFDDTDAMLADARDYTAHTAGDVFWTAAEGFRYVVAASDATDHHLTTGGGVKVYVLPGDDGFYNFKAFGAEGDNTTDDYDALMTAIYKTENPYIYFPVADYYISATVHLKRPVVFKSHHTASASSPPAGKLRWPTGTRGLWVERNDTFNGRPLYFYATLAALEAVATTYSGFMVGARAHITGDNTAYEVVASDAGTFTTTNAGGVKWLLIDVALLGPAGFISGRGQGSLFEGMHLDGTSATADPDVTAHGIHSQARINIVRCRVENFSGDGVHIFAATDRKVNGPGETYGEASLCQIDGLQVHGNGVCGFFNQGYDAQAGTFRHIDAVFNGRWGVWEKGFLGNTHIGHHLAANGTAEAPINGEKSSLVTYGGNRYYAHMDATEQQLVDTTPGTNSAIWVLLAAGGASSAVPTWQASQALGTYFPGGSMIIAGDSARNLVLYCYTESSQGPTWVDSQSSILMGGIMGAGVAGTTQLRGALNGALEANRFRAGSFALDTEAGAGAATGLVAQLGGDSTALLTASGVAGTGDYRFRTQNGNDWRWDYNNGNTTVAFELTGNTTERQFGTGAAVQYLFAAPIIGLGASTNARRMSHGYTAAPTTGAWARGDIVWNRDPAAAGWAGWICVTAGTPGTWKTFGAISL